MHFTAAVLQAGAAVCQVLVFQLQTGRQQVDHQRVWHILTRFHFEPDQHQFTAAQGTERFTLTIGSQNLALDVQHIAGRYGRRLRVSAAVQTQPQRLVAAVGHLQRGKPIDIQITRLRFIARQRLVSERSLRLPCPRQIL